MYMCHCKPISCYTAIYCWPDLKKKKKKIITSQLPVTLRINVKVKFILFQSYVSWGPLEDVLKHKNRGESVMECN